MAFVDEVSAPSGLGVLLSNVGGMVNPVAAGLGAFGGLSSMFDGGSGMDVSRAVSGGTFTTGEMKLSKSGTLIVLGLVVLGLLILFKGKK